MEANESSIGSTKAQLDQLEAQAFQLAEELFAKERRILELEAEIREYNEKLNEAAAEKIHTDRNSGKAGKSLGSKIRVSNLEAQPELQEDAAKAEQRQLQVQLAEQAEPNRWKYPEPGEKRIEQERDDLAEKLSQTTEAMDLVHQENERLRALLKEKRAAESQAKPEGNERAQAFEIIQLNQELKRLQDDNRELRDGRDRIQRQLEELRAELRQLKSIDRDNGGLRREIGHLTQELVIARRRVGDADQELQALRAKAGLTTLFNLGEESVGEEVEILAGNHYEIKPTNRRALQDPTWRLIPLRSTGKKLQIKGQTIRHQFKTPDKASIYLLCEEVVPCGRGASALPESIYNSVKHVFKEGLSHLSKKYRTVMLNLAIELFLRQRAQILMAPEEAGRIARESIETAKKKYSNLEKKEGGAKGQLAKLARQLTSGNQGKNQRRNQADQEGLEFDPREDAGLLDLEGIDELG